MAELIKGFQTNEGTKRYDYNALANLPTLISQDDIGNAVADALAQAKQNGDFKGEVGPKPEKGVDYWTVQDQQDIINSVLSALPTWEGGEY